MGELSKILSNKLEKRKRILDSSFNLFSKNGINSTSIQDIVDESNLAKGTFYLYFKDKYAVRDELVKLETKKLFDEAYAHLDIKKYKTITEQLIFIVDYVIDLLSKDEKMLKFIANNISWGTYSYEMANMVESDELGIKKLFIEGLEKDNIKLDNPDVTFYIIIELVASTSYTSLIFNKPMPINKYKNYLNDSIKKLLK